MNKSRSNKSKEKSLDLNLNLAINDPNEEQDTDNENERKLKMLEEMEAGGVIEDIDLTTDDWVNVNPTEMAKRYDMLRRYVSGHFGLVAIATGHRESKRHVFLPGDGQDKTAAE